MAVHVYDYTCKYSTFIFAIYGYSHKNLNFNATYMAYKMDIDFWLMSENKKMMV